MARTEHHLTSVGDFRIHSAHAGEGPPVVLLHGLSGSLRWWRYTVRALAPQYRVHVLDLVGFGRSRPVGRQPDITEMAGLVADWLAIHSVVEPHVVGHSMGGQIAVHLAAGRRPPRSLALVCATGIPHPRNAGEAMRIAAGAIRPRAWGAPAFVPEIAFDALRAGPVTLLRAGVHLLADDVRPLLPVITCPTLVVWGAADPLLPVEDGQAFARAIPGARLVVIGDAAHNPMIDRAWEFNRVLLDFLERV